MATQSVDFISSLSRRFGTVDFSRWQLLRWQWWGFTTYSVTSAPTLLSFFGNAVGQGNTTLADTNLPKAGSFGQQHFLLKTISTAIKIGQKDLGSFTVANVANADSRSLASDLLMGFAQAGVLTLNIASRKFAEVPMPFMYCPPVQPTPTVGSAGVNQFSAAAANATDQVVGVPDVDQLVDRDAVYRPDPNILIEAEQQFEVKISFDSGPIPIIATGLNPAINDATNPLKVGVVLDGYLLRPRQ